VSCLRVLPPGVVLADVLGVENNCKVVAPVTSEIADVREAHNFDNPTAGADSFGRRARGRWGHTTSARVCIVYLHGTRSLMRSSHSRGPDPRIYLALSPRLLHELLLRLETCCCSNRDSKDNS
jgi:hypothetical protein